MPDHVNGVVDPIVALVDVGFPLIQSIFGANPNLIQYLPESLRHIVRRYPAWAGVIDPEVLAALNDDDDGDEDN